MPCYPKHSYLWQICSPVTFCMIPGCFWHDQLILTVHNGKIQGKACSMDQSHGALCPEGSHFGVQCSMVATLDCLMILLWICGLYVAKRTTEHASGTYNFSPRVSCLLLLLYDFLAATPGPSQFPFPSPVQWLQLSSALAGPWVLVQGSLRSGVHALHTTEHLEGGRRIWGHVSVRPNLLRPYRDPVSILKILFFKQRALHFALHWDYKLHSWSWSKKNRLRKKKHLKLN